MSDHRLRVNDALGVEDFCRFQCRKSKAKFSTIARTYIQVCERFVENFNAAIAALVTSEKKGRPWPRDIINRSGEEVLMYTSNFIDDSQNFP
jgi:hypothetical protein